MIPLNFLCSESNSRLSHRRSLVRSAGGRDAFDAVGRRRDARLSCCCCCPGRAKRVRFAGDDDDDEPENKRIRRAERRKKTNYEIGEESVSAAKRASRTTRRQRTSRSRTSIGDENEEINHPPRLIVGWSESASCEVDDDDFLIRRSGPEAFSMSTGDSRLSKSDDDDGDNDYDDDEDRGSDNCRRRRLPFYHRSNNDYDDEGNMFPRMPLPEDPRLWSRMDVYNWLEQMSRDVQMDLDPDRFLMNGKALCLMTPDMFVYRVPRGGRLLYKDFQMRLSRALAILHHNKCVSV